MKKNSELIKVNISGTLRLQYKFTIKKY